MPPMNPNHDANMTGLRRAYHTILESAAGQDVKKKRCIETMAEMRRYVAVLQGLIVDALMLPANTRVLGKVRQLPSAV